MAPEGVGHPVNHLLNELRQLNPLHGNYQPAGLDPGGIHKVPNHSLQPFGAGENALRRPPFLGLDVPLCR